MKYSNQPIWKKVISSQITTIIVLILVLIMSKASWGIFKKASLSSDKLSQAQTELLKLKERQNDLAQKVEFLSTDEGVEAEIRTKFHAVKEGESVAVIIDDSQTASVVSASSTIKLSLWKKLLKMIGL